MKHLPHHVTEIPKVAQEAVSTSDWTPDLLTHEQREQLAELVPVLEGEIGQWEEIRQTLTINEIEMFASRMQEFSTNHSFPPLRARQETSE